MAKQITVLKVEKEKSPKGYLVTSLAYSSEGKTKGMKIYPFDKQKEVAEAFADAKPNDVYEVEFQKNDRDFWEFKPTPVKLGASAAEPMPVKKETWVPDADRQRMIVRQSSISSAVSLLKEQKGVDVAKVLEVAKAFEEYVMSKPTQPTGDVE